MRNPSLMLFDSPVFFFPVTRLPETFQRLLRWVRNLLLFFSPFFSKILCFDYLCYFTKHHFLLATDVVWPDDDLIDCITTPPNGGLNDFLFFYLLTFFYPVYVEINQHGTHQVLHWLRDCTIAFFPTKLSTPFFVVNVVVNRNTRRIAADRPMMTITKR